MKTDVVVIGAGAIGLTLAYELARRGRKITVVDRDRLDAPYRSASSWAAAGILPPANLESATDPIDRLRGLSHGLFPELAENLSRETGVDPQLLKCGGWYLADTIGETASMAGMVSYWRELSIECQEMGLAELAAAEPMMRPWAESTPQAKAWWVPDEYQIRTPLFLHALVLACRQRGVRFLDQSKVVDVNESEGFVAVSIDQPQSPQMTVHADQAVLCGGTWSGLISDRLRLSQSLVPVRGQMLLLKAKAPMFSSVINVGQRYFVPRADGSILVGSCEEEVGFQHGTTPGILSALRRFVREVCPPLASTAREIAAWSGLRPLTFDGFPMCGKLPDSESIFVSTGHFRSGVHLSPGTARCMADLMSGRTPPIQMNAFGVGKQQLQHHALVPTAIDV
jgi:glycine oxidase